MSKKIYLHLLFFFAILCQGILATLSDNHAKLSSDSLVRKRRVVAQEAVNYIVRIYLAGNYVCQGTILSPHTVITAALCIPAQQPLFSISVASGGTHDGLWSWHNITSKRENFGNLPHQNIDGILLMTVNPPFVYSRKTGNLELHAGPLRPDTPANILFWEPAPGRGVFFQTKDGLELRRRLHTVTLPILNHRACTNLYSHRWTISEKHICTVSIIPFGYEDDIGSPLVVNNRLAGIHTLKGIIPRQIHPDVFVNLQLAENSQWIRANLH